MNTTILDKTQIELAAGVVARALRDDPLWAYFFPDASEKPDKLSHTLRFLVRHGVSHDQVHAISPNLEGVAVWLPSDNADMSPWQMMLSGGFSVMLKMGWGAMVRSMRYTEYASAMHRRCAPFRHWYLHFIGVDPVFQEQGYASELLRPMLARMDMEQLPCYLETQNRENVPLYQHHGFRVVEEGTVPGTDVGHWAMLR